MARKRPKDPGHFTISTYSPFTHGYAHYDVLVVGGGSSAAEVALECWREGANVTVVMRNDKFHTKFWVEPDIENRITEGSITCYRNAHLSEILVVEGQAVTRDESLAPSSIGASISTCLPAHPCTPCRVEK